VVSVWIRSRFVLGRRKQKNNHSVRLGNTDPGVIKCFLEFLTETYQIDKTRLRFGLQIFSDISPKDALNFWTETLGVSGKSFHKIIITKSGKLGTCREKNRTGVLTIYFSNTKLRDIIVSAITELQKNHNANVAQMVERVHGE